MLLGLEHEMAGHYRMIDYIFQDNLEKPFMGVSTKFDVENNFGETLMMEISFSSHYKLHESPAQRILTHSNLEQAIKSHMDLCTSIRRLLDARRNNDLRAKEAEGSVQKDDQQPQVPV